MKYAMTLALVATFVFGLFSFAPSADASCYYFCSGYANTYYGRASYYDLDYSRDRYYDSYYRYPLRSYYRDDIVRAKKKQALYYKSYDYYYGY